MDRKFSILVATISTLTALGLALYFYTSSDVYDDFDDEVLAIVSAGQAYSGEIVEKLVLLGPDAVPAIGRALAMEKKFPRTYVLALSEIGGPGATEPLLDHLEGLRPLDDQELVSSLNVTIRALGRVGDSRSVAALRQIMVAAHAHPNVRLSAATALAMISETKDKGAAQQFIMEMYRREEEFYGRRGAGFSEIDMFHALIALDTDESFSILANMLANKSPSYGAVSIIEYMATKQNDIAADALFAVVDNAYNYEYPIRVSAVEGLVGMSNRVSYDELKTRADSLLSEGIEGKWPTSAVERAKSAIASLDKDNRAFHAQVAEIVAAGQSYDGEHEDRLASLGPAAVPAIAEAMLAAEKFRAPYIAALARIGSADAMEPLLDLLQRQEPLKFDTRGLVVNIVDALKLLGDRRAVGPLAQIIVADTAHPRVRLAASGAVARIDSGSDRKLALDHIYSMYAQRWSYYGRRGEGFEEQNMNSALIDANTDESLAFLIESLNRDPPPYISIPIIEHLSTKTGRDIVGVLLNVIDSNQSHEFPVRLKAIESLAGMSTGLPREEINRRLDAIIVEARNDGWPQEFVEKIEDLRAR